jgi:diguanylate cyclase (GGDEF)-like protein
MIVSDNPSITFWIKKYLSEQFFVLAASSPKEALDALNAKVDFIIVDATFQDCDALELCKLLSQKTAPSLTPILLITGKLKKSFRDQALESGVTDFLSDQLDLEELETRIAIGKKATLAREKTEAISSLIPIPKKELSSAYLKKKFLLANRAAQILTDASETNKPISLLYLRIDHFDSIERRYAATLAEEILIPFSDCIHHFLPESNLLIPSSEGSFILLFSDTKEAGAKTIAEQLREEIQNQRFETQQGFLHLTISIAYSEIEPNQDSYSQTLESAAKALREALPATNVLLALHGKK